MDSTANLALKIDTANAVTALERLHQSFKATGQATVEAKFKA